MKSATALIVVAAILSVALGLNCFECPTCGEQGTNKGDFCPTGCGEVAAAAGGAGTLSADSVYGVCSYTGQTNANGDRVAPGDSGAACAASGYCGGCICKTGENEFVNGYGNGTPYTIGGSGTKIIDNCCHLNDDICNLLIADASCPAQSTKVNPSDVPGNQGLDACVPGSNLFAHGNEYYDAADDEYKWDGWGNCCTCLCDDGNDCTDDTYDHETNTCIFTERCAPLTVLNDPDHECQQRTCTPGSTPAGQCDWFTDTNARCDTDGNPCTVGTCIPDAADPQSATCQDGDGAKRDDCDSGNPCEAGTCVDNVGCEVEQIATGQSCLGDGDGDKCTINDICNADGVCEGEKRCADSQTCDPLVGQCVDSTPLAVVGAGIAGAAICAAVAAAGLLNRRGDEEDNESWAKMSSGSSYGNKRMTTATQMSSFTRGGGSGDRSSRGSRSSRSSKGKRMTGITQMSGASRGDMMGLERASSGSRATMGTVASQMSRATRSTSGSRNSRSSRGSRNSRSSKGRSHASQGTRSSGSRNSRSSRGRH